VGQHLGFVRFAERFSLLDSGLRRNDGLMDYLGSIKESNGLPRVPNAVSSVPSTLSRVMQTPGFTEGST